MMKMNSKKILLPVAAVLVNLSLISSVWAYAGIDTLLEAKKKAEGFKDEAAAKGICLRIDEISNKMNERMDQKGEQIEKRIEERKENMEKNRGERDDNLTEFRNNADEWREDSYNILESKAITDEQKKAVKKFKETVEAAVETRRDAIDAAIDAFRSGVDQAIVDHLENVDGVVNTYRNTVRTALEKAKSDCDNEVDSKTVRTNLHASLKAAGSQLKEDKTGVTKFSATMQSLIDAKKAAFEKAITDFKTAMKAAVAELKKSLPESDNATE